MRPSSEAEALAEEAERTRLKRVADSALSFRADDLVTPPAKRAIKADQISRLLSLAGLTTEAECEIPASPTKDNLTSFVDVISRAVVEGIAPEDAKKHAAAVAAGAMRRGSTNSGTALPFQTALNGLSAAVSALRAVRPSVEGRELPRARPYSCYVVSHLKGELVVYRVEASGTVASTSGRMIDEAHSIIFYAGWHSKRPITLKSLVSSRPVSAF